jgi:hypothetical protein
MEVASSKTITVGKEIDSQSTAVTKEREKR